jgi:hypothetical protein
MTALESAGRSSEIKENAKSLEERGRYFFLPLFFLFCYGGIRYERNNQ